jgi:hypothetical protein
MADEAVGPGRRDAQFQGVLGATGEPPSQGLRAGDGMGRGLLALFHLKHAGKDDGDASKGRCR